LAKLRKFQVHADKKQRLDSLLAESLAQIESFKGVTRSQVKNWIEAGLVLVNDKLVRKAGTFVDQGDRIVLDEEQILALGSTHLAPLDLKLKIVYEDENLLVVDKPPFLTVHPGAGNKDFTLANALVAHLSEDKSYKQMLEAGSGKQRPGIVHRLDKDTSGLLVVAKNIGTQAALSKQFAEKTTKRAYYALVFTTPRANRTVSKSDQGTISANLGRDPKDRKKMAVLKNGGKSAVTHWKVIERMPYATLLELRLETGRTHQIRVHLRELGSPVMGDRVYGDFSGLSPALKKVQSSFGRQALHAHLLEFTHPQSGKLLAFKSPLPPDFKQLISAFGGRADGL